MFLLDTNTIIYYLNGSLPSKGMEAIAAIVDDQPAISIITKIELLGFNIPDNGERELTGQFVEASFIFNLDDAIVNQTIELRKKYKIKIPDAIIAATAMVFSLTVITRNTNDFNKIANLQCADPFLL